MIAFCAIYTVQGIGRKSQSNLCDWSLFQIATIEILIRHLQEQTLARYQGVDSEIMSAVDAMSRQLVRRVQTLLSAIRNTRALECALDVSRFADTFTASSNEQQTLDPVLGEGFDDLLSFSDTIPFVSGFDFDSWFTDV